MASAALGIQRTLDETKRRVKLLEASTVAIALVTFALVFFTTEILLDRVFLLDRSFRSSALLAFEALGAVALLLGLVFAGRRVSDLFAARALERHSPSLRQSLLTYVQMRSGDALGSALALRLIEEKLSADLPRIDFGSAVRRRLWVLVRAAAIVAAVFLGAGALAAGRGFGVCLERALRPDAGIAPPTRTRIAEVAPRDAHALVGQDVPLSARIDGVPPKDARVYLSYEEGSWFTVPMTPEGGRWRAVLPGAQLSCRYFIAAGDTRSDRYAVTVHPPAVLEKISAVVEFPSYTGLPERRTSGGDIEAPPESTITLWGAANRALRSATIVFENGERVPFAPRTAPWFRAEFVAKASRSYRVETVDEFGLPNPMPPTFRFEARSDRPPEVAVLQPDPVAEIQPEQPIEIVIEATDDYGVCDVALHYRKRGEAVRTTTLAWSRTRGDRQSFRIGADSFGLAAPSSMMYWIEARDRAPSPHVGRSAIHVLHLRRRPLEEIARYESLKTALLSLEKAKAPDSADVIRKQRDLAEAIRKLGTGDELRTTAEELRRLRAELEKTLSETGDLQNRGVEKQESLAALLRDRLDRLRERAESLRERTAREAERKDLSPRRREALQEALRKLEEAIRRLDASGRAMAERRDGDSLNAQSAATRDLSSAEKALRELLSSELPEEERTRAEELARLEKLIRELTEELRDRASPEEEDRLRKAARSMRDAQRALEQGNPGTAQEKAEEALYQLERGKEGEPTREADSETARSLERLLREMASEQGEIGKETREIDARRDGGVLRTEDADRLAALSKGQGDLAGKAEEAGRLLESGSAPVFAWSLEAIRADLIDLRDRLDPKRDTGVWVRNLQESILTRLKELLEALRSEPRPNGAGQEGGTGAPPPQVTLEAELKMARALQADILRRTEAVRSKCNVDADLGAGDRLILNRLAQQQDDLKRLLEELAERSRP